MIKSNSTLAFGFVMLVGGFTSFATPSFAEAPSSADISCLQKPAKLSDDDIKSFMANPAALLSDNPTGGLPLSTRVHDLAGSSSQAFNKIMDLVAKANAGQKSAIASGFAQVVSVCTGSGNNDAQNYGAQIQTTVAAGDPTFASTFQQSSKDISTASNGPGAAGTNAGGGTTDGDLGQDSGQNQYKSPGDGPIDTTTGDYTIGQSNSVLDDVSQR